MEGMDNVMSLFEFIKTMFSELNDVFDVYIVLMKEVIVRDILTK